MKPFELEIITPESTVFKGQVSSLIFPAHHGYMGVLGGHASFAGSLGTGKTTFNIVTEDASKQNEPKPSVKTYSVKDGFIEITSKPFSTTKITILAENIEEKDKIMKEKE
ncbi:MAG: F0F1 ATP synthase subunit epsilon [Planctomycetes bacterium]|nr:F0F1 ATP synthase subunit epsilon [Planctomycetota bacterium]